MVAVEDTRPIIIPTRYKAKISGELSFPIGAEKISAALASVPQLSKLVLQFSSDYKQKTRSGQYICLRVRYARLSLPMNPLSPSGIPLFNEWEIEVKPVPRTCRHRIQEHIVHIALPQIERWLLTRSTLEQRGSDTLVLSYDQQSDTFSVEQESRLEPSR